MPGKLLFAVLLCAVPHTLQAADPPKQEAFDYPELQVVPRASDRLKSEAAWEEGARWTRHIPVQLSSLATLVSAIAHFGGGASAAKDPDHYAGLAGLGVGGGWLVTTALLSVWYNPYADGAAKLATFPKGGIREQLTTERYAEQSFASASRLATRLTWLSVISCFGASIYMTAKAEAKSATQVISASSALLAFTPLLFRYRWSLVASEQEDYKKKIYGPVASLILAKQATGAPAPGLGLSVTF